MVIQYYSKAAFSSAKCPAAQTMNVTGESGTLVADDEIDSGKLFPLDQCASAGDRGQYKVMFSAWCADGFHKRQILNQRRLSS